MANKNNGTSAPDAVPGMLTRNYPVYQFMKMRVINFHSLAELIRSRVQEVTGREVTINILVAVTKRFSDTLGEIKTPDIFKALKNVRVSLSSRIVGVSINAPKT